MSTGLAIFLSALISGVVLLYGITKEGWKWAPRSRRIALGFAATILGAGVVSSLWLNYQQARNPFRRQTTYAELTLGMTMADVRSVKGNPNYLRSGNPFYDLTYGFIPTTGMSDAKIDTFVVWYYGSRQQIDLVFGPSMKMLESIGCEHTHNGRCPLLWGVKDEMSEKTVIGKLGKPNSQKLESGTKTLTYDNLGIWLSLENGKVSRLGIGTAD